MLQGLSIITLISNKKQRYDFYFYSSYPASNVNSLQFDTIKNDKAIYATLISVAISVWRKDCRWLIKKMLT